MRSRLRLWSALVAVLVFAAVAFSLLDFRSDSSSPASTTERLVPHLARIVGDRSPLEGRLSDGPLLTPTSGGATSAMGFSESEELMLEAHLERLLHEDLSAENLHSRGLLRLFDGRFAEAIDDLTAARLLAPESLDLAIDLSSAYLRRFGEAGDPLDLLLAADAAFEASQRDPSAQAAAYNLALTLDAFHLTEGAAEAFERYLTLDPSSEWADEARRRIAAIRAPTLAEEWAGLKGRLASEAASAGLGFDLEDSPAVSFQLLTHTAEVLLPEWAAEVQEGREHEAEVRLARIAEVGRALATVSTDETIARTVAALDGATGTASGMSRLTETFLDWEEGTELLRASDCAAAEELLERAEAGFRAMASPLADWAAYHRAVCAYFDRIPDALERFRSLRESILAQGASLPMLLGRVEWMLGLTITGSGDWAAALPLYAAAADRFRAAGDAPGQAGIFALMTEAHKQLGESHAAWRTRLEGLATAATLGEPKQRVRTLSECVPALLSEERLVVASLFLDDFLREARRWEEGKHGLATALLTRAQLSRRMGRPGDAVAALDEADRLRKALPPGPLGTRLEADVQVERGLLQVDLDPQEAAAVISETLARFEEIGYETQNPTLLNARARARTAMGDVRGAVADLEGSLRLIEERREAPEQEALRISYFETFQGAFEDMMRFQAEHPEGARRAFVFADLSRSRALQDRLARLEGAGPEDGTRGRDLFDSTLVETLQAALPRDVALVQFTVLPEALLTWVLRSDDFVLTRTEISADDLRRQVELFERVLDRAPSDETSRRVASGLFTTLLAPVRDRIATAGEVVLVPDRFLARVPFAALFDPDTGRYLVEDFTLSLAPSARLLVSDRVARRSGNRERPSLLAVAGNGFDRERFPSLPPLPEAEVEARAVAALYDDAEVLGGSAATPGGLLAGLPGRTVLHFAGHAVPGRRGAGSVSLALAPDGIESRNGAMVVTDLASRSLREVEVAFLSACSTFGVSARSEREGIEGIARELLAAGVTALVASSRPVADRPAADVAVAFHRALVAGAEPASALRTAQLELLESGNAVLRSPSSWATFQLYRRSLQTMNREQP